MHQVSWYHDAVGCEYDTNREETRLERDDPIECAITLRYLRRYVPNAATVADIGVGGGQYSEALARRDCLVHLADVSLHLLDVAAARIEAAGLGRQIASARRASATDLSHLGEGCCDVVLLLGPLYHLITPEERDLAIAEAARLLRPGGLAFAAGINRLTCLRDVLRSGPDDFVRRRDFFEQLWIDGNLTAPDGQPATMHVTDVAEFRADLGRVFDEVVLVGVEAFASKSEGRLPYMQASPETRAAMLDIIGRAGATPEGLGVTSHYLYIGRKSAPAPTEVVA